LLAADNRNPENSWHAPGVFFSKRFYAKICTAMKERESGMKAIVVASVLVEKDGKFLMVQQARSRRQPGMWGLPGGKPDHAEGETLSEAAKRETLEEIGQHIELTGFAGLVRSGHREEPNLFVCFAGRLANPYVADQLKLAEGEISGAVWVTPDEMADGTLVLRADGLVELARRVLEGHVYPLEIILHDPVV
jgi:ADP-ribose pyrophosphatase YjhB (NUDIX family)